MTKNRHRKRVLSLPKQIHRGEFDFHLIFVKSTAVEMFGTV